MSAQRQTRKPRSKERAARRRLFNSIPMIVDQSAINAGFDSRRQAMKPRPSTWAMMPRGFAGSTAAAPRGGAGLFNQPPFAVGGIQILSSAGPW
jgi:hypothetical protein